MRYRNENIRQKWSRRFQEALAEPSAPSVESPDEAWAVPPGPGPEPATEALWRAPTHDYAADVRRLEEELRRQQDSVAEAREAQRLAETELAGLRAEIAMSEQRIRMLTISLEEAQSRFAPQDSALAEAVHRLEREREEARRALAEKDSEAAALKDELAQARVGASVAFESELKKRDEELQELRALHEKLGASQSEKAGAHADLEKRLAEREAAFQKERQEQQQAQETVLKNLRQKETELKLLAENTNRLSQQNKELVAKLQTFKDAPPAAAQAAVAEPDPAHLEKIGALEVALEGRDRMLADLEKAMEARRVQIEQMSLELKDMQESKTLVQNLSYRMQALIQEKEKLEQTLKAGVSQADKDKQEVLAKTREKEIDDLKKAVAALEAEKTASTVEKKALEAEKSALQAEKKALEAAPQPPAAPPAPAAQELETLQKQIAKLKAKNEDLETQVRLVVMNSEAIERMEKGLRDSLRQMALMPALPASAPRRSFTELIRGPGFFTRLWSWWRAPLLRISRKKSAAAPPAAAPAPGGVPPGVERLRQMRRKR